MRSALSAVRRALDAGTFVLFMPPAPDRHEPTHYLVEGVSQRAVVEYQDHFFEYDLWMQAVRAARLAPGSWVCGHELVPVAQLQASYFGREFLSPQGLHDVLAGVVDVADERGEVVMLLSFHKSRAQGLFDARAKSLIESLVPHFRRAMRMHLRIAPQLALGNSLRDMCQQADAPMFYVSADGRLRDANIAAGRLLDGGSGQSAIASERPFEPHLPALSVRLAEGWQPLARTLDRLAARADPSLVVPLASGDGSAMELAIRRVHGAQGDDLCAAPVFAVCMVRRTPARDAFAQLALHFRLTPSETETLRLLGLGQSPAQIAHSRGVRISTVRSQLANSFSKTGTRRQAELLALVARLPTG
jgi:DNA-binding CsgD family transcriptional regulator